MSAWLTQNWIWLLLFAGLLIFGWWGWPQMQPNPRRILASGIGFGYLTFVVVRLAAGAAFPLEIIVRSVLMGLAGVILLLSAYKDRFQGSLVEFSGWGILGASALVSVFLRGMPWWIQAPVFLIAVLGALALQWFAESPVSEWENPGKGGWMR